ncbi:MAG: DNA methyltransferase [Anaerolineae bacterium]
MLSGKIEIGHSRLCDCPPKHINCLTAGEWLRAQIGVWQFSYEGRDIRDRKQHPATFPISLAAQVISLFTHAGELVVDPFVGSGTTLVAARDLRRNAMGFDINAGYIDLCHSRLAQLPREDPATPATQQIAVQDDARHIPHYLEPETIKLFFTSPPYANLLNRRRKNKSRRGEARFNEQFGAIEQYSQDSRDLGTLELEAYQQAMADIFAGLLPLLKPRGHCVVNIPDMWWENERITLHIAVVEALRSAGYELRNTIIWDKTNIVNRVGIFGWPSNYITMGITYEYLLHFWRPA